MESPRPDVRSAFKARGDVREYNVYVQTANVEEAWPDVNDWLLGPQIGPLLVSLEVALQVLDETLDEAGTRVYLNDAAKVDVVAASVSSVLTLIVDLAFEYRRPADTPEGLFGPPSRESAWRTVMEKLDRVDNGVRLAADLRFRYDLAVRALGFDLGLVRTRSKRRFDYDRWVRPGAVHRLYAPDRRERYIEDPIFVRVHQVCEGILEALLVELNKVEAALFEADYATAERHVLMASRFMKPFERTVSQLSEMSQLDYAPLRVALRDASGIQSARAQARKEVVQDHFWLFRQQLKRRGLDCFVVLANHVELAREYRLLQAFKTLGKTINESMSHHAHLVTNTLGSTVIGTVGFRILSLGEIAAMPLFRDLAKALDRLTLWTSLRFADHSGIVIHEQEREHGAAGKYEFDLPTAPCRPALMTATTGRYFDAIRKHAKDEWKALFSESPHFEDPRGTKPYVSDLNLDVFFRNFQKLFPKVLAAEHTVVERGANHLKAAWRIEAESFLRKMVVRFGGTETFHFDPDGRIRAVFADWRPDALAEEMMRRYRDTLAAEASAERLPSTRPARASRSR